MPTCSFCKKHYEFPRGLTLFHADGKALYFCSSKCKRNHNLKRVARKVNWVKKQKSSRAEARKEIQAALEEQKQESEDEKIDAKKEIKEAKEEKEEKK